MSGLPDAGSHVTDEQIGALARTATPFSAAILHWGPRRFHGGADATELEHQRRMVALRADGVIRVLLPVASDDVCGVAVIDLPLEAARTVMEDDPCVRADVMRVEVLPCHGFPGDAIPRPDGGVQPSVRRVARNGSNDAV